MNTNISNLFTYSGAASRGNKNTPLPDPYVLYSTYQMPTSMENVLRLCEHLWLVSGQYKMAMQRITRYFLTKITFSGVSDKEKKKYQEFFYDQLHIMTHLAEVGDDFSCYGNSFSSLYMPFNRIVICTQCKLTRNIDHIQDDHIGIDVRELAFKIHCPRCGKKTKHDHKDIRSTDESRIHLIRWNPHEFQLLHSFISGETDYLWQITPEISSNVKSGKAFWLKHMPWEIVETIMKDSLFRFKNDVVYHMKEPVIAGVRNRGWGIPRMLAAYKDIYYTQILKRYNEALALDYIVPFRVLTPAKATGPDPFMNYDLSSWNSQIQNMIADHRRDPGDYHTMPFPVNYQVLGGEGQSLSPFQLLKQGTADMMDSLGVPIELFQGNLQLQTAPTAMRLFESSWPHLIAALNGWLNWVMTRVANTFGWQPATVELQRTTYADDLERRSMLFQLNAGQKISDETAFATIGADPEQEQRRIMEEAKMRNEMQREFEEAEMKRQELQETMAQSSAPPQAMMGMGQPGVPGGQAMAPDAAVPPQAGLPGTMPGQQSAGPITPQDLLGQAQEIAGQLWGMDYASRRRELTNMKNTNPVLWAQVKGMLQQMETDASSQGVAMSRQQAAGGGM